MRPNPRQERLYISEIHAGLVELEKFLGVDPASHASPLHPFKAACEVYQLKAQDPFGVEFAYETASFRECVLFMAAAMDLVRYFQVVRRSGEVKKLRPHFAKLGAGFFGVAGTCGIQMSKGSRLRALLAARGVPPPPDEVAKDATRKTVKLMLALAALNSFDGIEVENPDSSNAADPNPDLIVEHDGLRFGVACKSISSTHEETINENIAKGVLQIERAIEAGKVSPRCGTVLLDISALLDHERLYVPEAGQRWALEGKGPVFTRAVDEALAKVYGQENRKFHDILKPIFANSQLPRGVFIYAHGVMLCENSGATIPVYQKALRLGFGGDVSNLQDFCERLNRSLHCQPG
jgi:hypothetical protein